MAEKAKLALGEIALRVNDLEKMQAFYSDVVGLELMRRFPTIAFFKIGEGYAGHTQVIALFDRSNNKGVLPVDAAKTSVDHIAFSVSKADFYIEKARLEALDQPMTFAEHDWVQWRSLYINDPEGNTVEWVYFDPDF